MPQSPFSLCIGFVYLSVCATVPGKTDGGDERCVERHLQGNFSRCFWTLDTFTYIEKERQ